MVMSFLFSFSDDLILIPHDQLISFRSIRVIIVFVVFVFMGVLNLLLAKFNKKFNYLPVLYWFLTLIIALCPFVFFLQQVYIMYF